MNGEEIEAIIVILREKGSGAITRAVETGLTWLVDPETLKEKGSPFSAHYLSHQIRERILSGESILDIANEIRNKNVEPEDLNKVLKPSKEFLPSGEKDDIVFDGEEKKKKKEEKVVKSRLL
ncbi:MAG: hypothetical protein U9N34_10345 [Candidatus Cloacimonadota bacterium]|nr:hypothetical protein [Candidatus Cloacimonadota bacterium]